jgi:tetratricopeptide (TPR) repeat protein
LSCCSRIGVVVCAALTLCATEGVRAQAGEQAASADRAEAEEMAKGLFRAGRAAYDAGNFKEALDYFQQAYARSPRPKLLFNIGQSADRLRMDELALRSFEGYLQELPEADNREHVENRIRALRQVIAERQRRQAEQAQRERQQVEQAQRERQPAEDEDASAQSEADGGGRAAARNAGGGGDELPLGPILVAGGGGLVLAAGIIAGASAGALEDDYAEAPVGTPEEAAAARGLYEDAEDRALLSNVLLGVGAAGVIGGAVWYALTMGDDEADGSEGARASVRGAPWIAPSGGGVVLGASVRGSM